MGGSMAFFNKRYHPPGTSPGTLTEERMAEEPALRLTLFDYGIDELTIREDASPAECIPCLHGDGRTWVHVEGRPTGDQLQELGAAFRMHPLVMEDVLNTGQRPKIEAFEDQMFIIMSLPLIEAGLVSVHQVSLVLGKTSLVSFCETGMAPFEPIVKRLQDRESRLRSREVDFLLYSLLDVVIDQGFPLLEEFGFQLEEIEEQILKSPEGETLEKIHTIKRELILLRRMLWPQREVINQLLRGDQKLVQEDTLVYLRDCYDHTVHVMDLLETYRDMSASMLEIYLSSVSNRMNDVMRVLTVIATIFIPLTFIAGIYGMNFDRSAGPSNMPELGWPYGYLTIWAVMIAIVVGMLLFFRRKGWF